MIGLYWFMHHKKNSLAKKSHKQKMIICLSCEHAAGNSCKDSWN